MISKLEKLKKAKSLSDLALLLGYNPKGLSYILYNIPADKKYKEFKILKRNGKERQISNPTPKLKEVQKRLAELLTKCYDEIHYNKKKLSHSFVKDCSIITNAKNHVNKRHLLNIDLVDFFQTINFGRVRGYFIKCKSFELNDKVSTVIAQIACHKNGLPQGSPCSPIISNLVGHIIDSRMVTFAKHNSCFYSRYADDLTFSTNKKEFPNNLAVLTNDPNEKWVVSSILRDQIINLGFKINDSKTSLQSKYKRQVTTGLVVNKKVNTKKEIYKLLRAMCYSLFSNGEYKIHKSLNSYYRVTDGKGTIEQLIGITEFSYSIKRTYDTSKTGNRRNYPNGITKLYRSLLAYKYFFSNSKPILLCEGPSDIIHLKCAIKNLKNDFPMLSDEKDGKFVYNVSFLNFSPRFKDVFAISQGTSGLKVIMENYQEYISKFKNAKTKNPVIIILDSDEGAKEIKTKFKQISFEYDYKNLFENLYVIMLPKNNIAIEDLYDSNLLSTKINGKSFSRKSEINNTKEYGKMIFAKKVISEKLDSVNFNGFKELLERIKLTIEHCENK